MKLYFLITNNNNTLYTLYDHGYRTHVAETIGIVGNNGKTVTGVNWGEEVYVL